VELEILYEIEIPSVRMVGVGRFVTFAAPQFQQQVIGGKQINKPVWNWDVGAEFRISIKKPGLQGLRP